MSVIKRNVGEKIQYFNCMICPREKHQTSRVQKTSIDFMEIHETSKNFRKLRDDVSIQENFTSRIKFLQHEKSLFII
jgi:hypothetical protein